MISLEDEIMQLMARDQAAIDSGTYTQDLKSELTDGLRKIISEYGWPGYNLAGVNGSFAAWLIAQHSDHDLQFQEDCLILLHHAVASGNADLRNLAYLTDRVLVNKGLLQIYGTQLHAPVEIRSLDEKRESMGLIPYSEYLLRSRDLLSQ